MSKPDWSHELRSARTFDELAAVIRTYLDTRPAAELTALPEELLPALITTPQELAAYAVSFVKWQCIYAPPGSDLNGMAGFFAAAANRLTQISAMKEQNEALRSTP